MNSNNCNKQCDPCKNAGKAPLVLSLSLAEILAEDRTNPELATIASFFSSLAANLGVIIQNRNLCNLNLAEEATGDDDFDIVNNPTVVFPPTARRN